MEKTAVNSSVRMLLLALLILLSAALPGFTLNQSLENADDLSVGDRFTLSIRADVPLNTVVVPDTLSSFQVIKLERITRNTANAWFRLTIVPLLPGSHSFPSLDVEPVMQDGKKYQTNRFRLNIIPVRAEADTLLVDIKPLQKYPLQVPWWGYLLLMVLLISFLLIYFLLSRKSSGPKPEIPKPTTEAPKTPDPAWKMAVDELDELLARDLIAQGQYVQHHYQLSLITRRFMERHYRFGALEMTSYEIRRILDRVTVASSPEIISFLSYCDKVKFAKYYPLTEEVHQAETWLRDWLLSFHSMDFEHLISRGGNPAPLR